MRPSTFKQVIAPLRWLLYIASGLTFIAGIQLVVLARHTDVYFAWTVKPALTAAVLGAFFWMTTVFGLLAANEGLWARVRLALPAVTVFTLLTLAATLVHFDRFHLSRSGSLTEFLTYVWFAVYILVPVLLLVMLYLQSRASGEDVPRGDSLPLLFRLLLSLHSVASLAAGIALFANPAGMIPLWGWDLTPLTARALGAWLVAIGICSAQAIWENDWARVKVGMISYALLGLLQLVVFVIFFDGILLANPGALVWVAYCLFVLIVGGYGAVEALRISRLGAGNHTAAEAASSGSLR